MSAPGALAAWLPSYGVELRDALDQAAEDQFRGVFATSGRGGVDARELSGSARRHLRRYLCDLGLTVEGIAIEWPGRGLADPARAEERLERLRGTLELCRELGVPGLTTDVGGFGDEGSEPLVNAVLREVAELCDRCGIVTAIRDPAGWTPNLEAAIRAAGCPNLRVALDTAQAPPAERWPALAGQTGVVYLRDIRRSGGHFQEVAYGTGEVDFASVLAGLESGGYPGAFVLRRDAPGGVDVLRQGREYIRSLIGRGRDR